MHEDVQQWVASLLRALQATLGERLGSVMLFGSWAETGPLYPESDLDVLIVTRRGDAVDPLFLAGIARAVQQVRHLIPYPLAPVPYNREEVLVLVGPLNAKLYAQTGQRLFGEDLPAVFQSLAERYPPLEIRRSAVRALLLSCLQIRQQVIHLLDTSPPVATRSLILSSLRAVRRAYWVVTGEFQDNAHQVILPRAEACFASLPQGKLLPQLWQTLLAPQLPVVIEATEVGAFVEDVTAFACRTFEKLSGTAGLWVDMRW